MRPHRRLLLHERSIRMLGNPFGTNGAGIFLTCPRKMSTRTIVRRAQPSPPPGDL